MIIFSISSNTTQALQLAVHFDFTSSSPRPFSSWLLLFTARVFLVEVWFLKTLTFEFEICFEFDPGCRSPYGKYICMYVAHLDFLM